MSVKILARTIIALCHVQNKGNNPWSFLRNTLAMSAMEKFAKALSEVEEGPFVLEVKFGLCNRLRVLFSAIHSIRAKLGHCICVWVPDEQCPGTFTSCFEPVRGVSFVESAEEAKTLSPHFASCTFVSTVLLWEEMIPVLPIRREISRLSGRFGVFNACHVRRTDLPGFKGKSRDELERVDSELARDLCDKMPQPWFLATDNLCSQRAFRTAMGDRVFWYQDVAEGSSALRHTDLFHTVVDLFVCVLGQHFHPTVGSSFSQVANLMRRTRAKKGVWWCEKEA